MGRSQSFRRAAIHRVGGGEIGPAVAGPNPPLGWKMGWAMPRAALEEMGGGGLRNPKACVPNMAQINFWSCKFHFFPL